MDHGTQGAPQWESAARSSEERVARRGHNLVFLLRKAGNPDLCMSLIPKGCCLFTKPLRHMSQNWWDSVIHRTLFGFVFKPKRQ